MFTGPWVNVADVPRSIELQACLCRTGALSPVLVNVPDDKSLRVCAIWLNIQELVWARRSP
eukprot:6182883-Alexandrium_andersonii.AAC.1